MALIGSTIDPSLFVNDYSGFANAGAIRGQATAQLGKDIAGAAMTGMSMYKDMKAQQSQTDAFGKSMDAMSKAFPDQAGMFDQAKMDVLDPNASLIDRVSRMNEFQNTLKMVQQQQAMNLNEQMKQYQMSGGAGGAAAKQPDNRGGQ